MTAKTAGAASVRRSSGKDSSMMPINQLEQYGGRFLARFYFKVLICPCCLCSRSRPCVASRFSWKESPQGRRDLRVSLPVIWEDLASRLSTEDSLLYKVPIAIPTRHGTIFRQFNREVRFWIVLVMEYKMKVPELIVVKIHHRAMVPLNSNS